MSTNKNSRLGTNLTFFLKNPFGCFKLNQRSFKTKISFFPRIKFSFFYLKAEKVDNEVLYRIVKVRSLFDKENGSFLFSFAIWAKCHFCSFLTFLRDFSLYGTKANSLKNEIKFSKKYYIILFACLQIKSYVS